MKQSILKIRTKRSMQTCLNIWCWNQKRIMYLTISSLEDGQNTKREWNISARSRTPEIPRLRAVFARGQYLPNSGYQHADHKFTPIIFVHCEQRQFHKPISCFIDAFCFTLFSRRGQIYPLSFMKNGGLNIYVSDTLHKIWTVFRFFYKANPFWYYLLVKITDTTAVYI